MRPVYHRACSYAFKCNPFLSKDLVHEAWLRHYEKEGTDLFKKDIYIVLRWIRNIWFSEIRDGMYMKNGEMRTRQFFTAKEEWSDEPNTIILKSRFIPPDEELISKEFYQELFKRVDEYTCGHSVAKSLDPKVLRAFLELVDQGYTYPEICREWGMSTQRVDYYKRKIKKIIKQMEMNSPFNGDTTKITKKITRKTFENNEQYKNYKYDPDAGCDANEYYETRTNGTDFILIREKND